MCGRLSLFAPEADLTERFDAVPTRPIRPRYNVAPGQDHPVVRNDAPDEMHFPTWGFVPHWADEFGGGHINARAETLAEKPTFRDAYRERRCLVLADGFYDWKKTATGKQPYRMTRADGKPFAMAGLWEPWQNGEQKTSFTVVTTEPNDLVGEIHHRMPVILAEDEESRWLHDDEEEFESVLDTFPGNEMRAYPVSKRVNSPKNDSPELVAEVMAEEDAQTGLGDFS
ncbi:Putative SOS response-associated peptidase YedK [Haladaptatus litoreus]|uniref:Putative SOS response-associated peptidase YedK n=1 Tax=Haladaptatus litoreus TaxID=553468 RepID=A0A1N7C2E9_9EURY|nr:SOS response-associated peptidase [Haladaptatus litoreus]SIR57633.1 Putative SOS response-associated peptidase YedK [Haladaptatus litoreus]